MINVEKILKRSWHILWNYRVLWIFGVLLALTIGGSRGGSGGNNGIRFGGGDSSRGPSINDAPEWARELSRWFVENVEPLFQHPEQHVASFVWIGVAFVAFILFVSLIVALIRYPSEAAVMRMVDEYEQTGTKLGFRQGWKLGWSRRAFRIWLIDLILGLPGLVFLFFLFILGVVVYFSITSEIRVLGIMGIVAAIGFGFLLLFVFIILMGFLGVLRHFFARSAALEAAGVIESFQKGWALFKGNWKSAGLMWLVMFGIGFGYAIAAIVLFFLLIPVYLIMLLPAALVAFFPGLVAFGIASLFSVPQALVWIVAVVVALPFFFMVLFSPLFLFDGWYKIYQSSVWTLTYREIKALASVSVSPLPDVDEVI